MSTIQRITKNIAFLTTADIASFIIGFFFTMYVARYLGAEGFGILSFALAFTAIFGVFTDIGLQQLMIREIARDRALAQKYLGNIAVLKIFLVIITFGLIALTINLLDYPWQTTKVVYLVALSVVFNAFSMMFYGMFRAHERMEFAALGRVLSSVLTLSGALYAISQDFSVVAFASVYCIVSAIALAYSFTVSVWKFSIPRIEIDLRFWKESLKHAWPFGLTAVFATVYYWIDSVMLSLMKGDELVGWYNAAYRLIFVLQFIPLAYFGAVFPVMSRFYVSSNEFLRFTYERSFKYLLILALPIGAGTTLLANKIILLIFGIEYFHSIVALQILVWSTVLLFVTAPFFVLFDSLNKQIVVTWVTGSCALLNVVLNLVLIPKYGVTGASIATVATQFVTLTLAFIWSRRIGYGISTKSIVNVLAKVSVSVAVMCVPIMYFKDFYILALVPLSALLYFAVLLIIRGMDREDMLLLRSLVPRKRTVDVNESHDRSG